MGKNKTLVVKANSLIEAKYKFTLWEMRVFTKMVSLLNKEDQQFDFCRLYIKDLIAFFGSTSNNDYDIIRKVPHSLSQKQVKVSRIMDEGVEEITINIFPTVRTLDPKKRSRAAYIELKFNDDLKPMLLELKKLFNKYDIKNIIPLRSVFSFRIFELLKQYESIGHREIRLEHLKEILGIENKYSLYANFKRKVILQAQKDLAANCDVKFTFEEKKKNRKVEAIVFHIHPNSTDRFLGENPVSRAGEGETIKVQEIAGTETKNDVFDELHAKVARWIKAETLKKWLSDFPENQVIAGIQYTLNRLEKGESIPNIGGYINKMVRQATLLDPIQNRKKEATERKKKTQASNNRKKELEAREKKLRQALYEKEMSIIEKLFREYPEVKTEVFIAAKTGSSIRSYDHALTDDENYEQKRIFRGAVDNRVKELYPQKFKANQEKYEPKIKAVRIELNSL